MIVIATVKEYLAQWAWWPLPPLPDAHATNSLVKVPTSDRFSGGVSLSGSGWYRWGFQALVLRSVIALDSLLS